MLSEAIHVVGKDGRFVAGARDGDVAETETEQVGMNARVGVNEDTLGGESLGTVAGNGVAVIEVAMVGCVEFDMAVVVETSGDAAVERNGFDHSEVAVRDTKRFIRRNFN